MPMTLPSPPGTARRLPKTLIIAEVEFLASAGDGRHGPGSAPAAEVNVALQHRDVLVRQCQRVRDAPDTEAGDRHPCRGPSRHARRHDDSLLIHFESPARVAILPSSVIAHFRWTYGRPVASSFRYGAFSRRASASHSPNSTPTPAARSRSAPRPATCGNGSGMAAT